MSSPLIENNIFYNNWGFRRYITSGSTDSYACGGAIALDQSSSLIKNNTFNSNYAFYENEGRYGLGATGRGGALYLTSFNGTIENNVFYKNTAVYYNANNATYLGNAINAVSGTPVIKNNIFSENKYLTRLTEACIRNSSLTSITIDYNCFYNNHPNENVTSNNEVTTDPLFTNAASNNFTLQSSSPCINTGDPLSAVESGGEPIIDMGIEEFISFASATYNSIDNSISDNIIPGKSLAVASVGSNISSIIELSISTPPNSSGERTVGRYWDISSTGDANIRLYFPTSAISEFTGAPTIFHYNGSNWEAIPTGAVQSAGTSSYVESSSPITSWSYFTVGDSEDPLPVELTSFAASVSNGKVILNWKTSTEVNNYGFEIQKMAKGKAQSAVPNGRQAEWEMVGFIEGSGNSNTPKSYSFTDNLTSYSYAYRIKQIDLDGSFTYSKEISVDAASFLPTEFILSQNYPNPFNPVTTIKYSVPSTVYVVLKIFDMLGRETTTLVNAQQPAGYYEVKFDASNLASGIYLYNLQAGEFSSVKKLILMK
ncbi:MAG: T9SS type A sorting domain-containing protein [Ignavibacteria bacterium]|nr:T9SS type A sorting domain-containing protein [Ignavibacteria bacterium]